MSQINFVFDRDFENFDVTIDLNNAIFRIRNPERKYVIKPVNLTMANENKAPVFLIRRVMLKKKNATIVSRIYYPIILLSSAVDY